MRSWGLMAAGFAAGCITGLFGAGGGMVLVPLLGLLTQLEDREIFPSSVCIILPICIVSLILLSLRQPLDLQGALPYLTGSLAGGFAAGKWGQNIPVLWLHRALGLLILWGGFRYLC